MARGSEAKTKITEDILKHFPDAFIAFDGKTIRIPYYEDSERIEIKVSLVAAKDCERSDNGALNFEENATALDTPAPVIAEATEEEIEKVKKLMAALNF